MGACLGEARWACSAVTVPKDLAFGGHKGQRILLVARWNFKSDGLKSDCGVNRPEGEDVPSDFPPKSLGNGTPESSSVKVVRIGVLNPLDTGVNRE